MFCSLLCGRLVGLTKGIERRLGFGDSLVWFLVGCSRSAFEDSSLGCFSVSCNLRSNSDNRIDKS